MNVCAAALGRFCPRGTAARGGTGAEKGLSHLSRPCGRTAGPEPVLGTAGGIAELAFKGEDFQTCPSDELFLMPFAREGLSER